MQRLNGPPREHLTAGQVQAIIEADSLEVDAGVELLDAGDGFVDDISAELVVEDSSVERGNFRGIHGTCSLRLTRRLDWGRDRVRPYMLLRSGGLEARVNLGVYLLATPLRVAGETPPQWAVEGYDKLEVLQHPVGATWRVEQGQGHLAAIADTIAAAGETKVRLAGTGDDLPLPADRVWPIAGEEGTEPATWLRVVNDLLAAVGYRGLWVDQDGWYRSEPATPPAERATEWTYDTASPRTTVGVERVEEADFFATPNRWVFAADDPAGGLPQPGAGLYVVDNLDDGPTSQTARARVITRVARVQAAGQAALETQGDRIVETDKRLLAYVEMSAGPNPLHRHFDVVRLADPGLGTDRRYLVTDWALPLDGADMTIRMRAI